MAVEADAVRRALEGRRLANIVQQRPPRQRASARQARAVHQLHRQKRVRLRHRRLGAVHDVGDEARPEGELDVVAVDVARLLLIDDEQMVAAGPPGRGPL